MRLGWINDCRNDKPFLWNAWDRNWKYKINWRGI